MSSFHLKGVSALICWHRNGKISEQNPIMMTEASSENLKHSASFNRRLSRVDGVGDLRTCKGKGLTGKG